MIKKIKVTKGDKYGNWTIYSDKEMRDKINRRIFLCVCVCGKKKLLRLDSVRRGNSTSCGCVSRANASKSLITHGGYGTRAYRTWARIKSRCNNKKNKCYPDYGGRGITYDPRWEKFENFLEDMGEAPKGTSIDRIDNDGNYCKENCRWATSKEQNRNRRNTRYIKLNGVPKPLGEVAESARTKYRIVYQRIVRDGWSLDRALETL